MLNSRKQAYTPEDIASLTTDLSTFVKLRDKAIQDDRLYTNTKDIDFKAEIKRYTQSIESIQKVLQYMLGKIESKLVV